MLVKFQWDEMYSVGIPEMDHQHKRFFEITNSIVDFINKGGDDLEKLSTLLSNMVGYSIYHLNFEEKYFNKYKYEDRLTHRDGHDAYRVKVQKIMDSAEEPTANVIEIATQATDFAARWLQEHILVTDKKYTDFFRKYPIEEHDDYELLM